MKTLRFQGHSDDLFCVDVKEEGSSVFCPVEEQDDCAEGKVMSYRIYSEEQGHGLHVVGYYLRNACWTVGIAQLEEGNLLPLWETKWNAAPYSVILELEVPDDAEVTIEDLQ